MTAPKGIRRKGPEYMVNYRERRKRFGRKMWKEEKTLKEDGRKRKGIWNKYGVKCGIDSSGSRMGQVARPMALLDYPQNCLLKNNSERQFSSSASKKVSSKRYTPDWLSNTQPTTSYHGRNWREENFWRGPLLIPNFVEDCSVQRENMRKGKRA
jgi:hypothetical protein